MTYLEIDKAIVDITKEKCIECKIRLDSIPKEKSTERKALQLEYGMYTFCGNAGVMINGRDRSKVLEIRKRFLEEAKSKYPRVNDVYGKLNDEEKLSLVAALQAEMYIREYWLGTQYSELASAEASGDINKIFEFKIKIGAALNMLTAWENWRVKNGVYPNMFVEVEI